MNSPDRDLPDPTTPLARRVITVPYTEAAERLETIAMLDGLGATVYARDGEALTHVWITTAGWIALTDPAEAAAPDEQE